MVCALTAALIKQQMVRLSGTLEGDWESRASFLLIAGVERGWHAALVLSAFKKGRAGVEKPKPPSSDIPEMPIPGMTDDYEGMWPSF